jgi:hypothetical protein
MLVALRVVVSAAGGFLLVWSGRAPWWVAAAIFACIAVPAEAGTIVRRIFGGGTPK